MRVLTDSLAVLTPTPPHTHIHTRIHARRPDAAAACLAVCTQELVRLTAEEMASEEKRQANHKIRQETAADLVRGQTQQASTDMFQ